MIRVGIKRVPIPDVRPRQTMEEMAEHQRQKGVVLTLVKIKCKNKLKKGQPLRELIEWINHIQIQGSPTFILEKMTEH